jgi:peptidoglycan/LPS O-acetylase OafA/YrhL
MSNWDIMIGYFSGGIPGSEYLWIGVILFFTAVGFVLARKMVSKI